MEKYISFFLFALLIGITDPALAQKKNKKQHAVSTRSAQEEQMTKSLVDYYMNVLKLTDAQKEKAQLICSEFTAAAMHLKERDPQKQHTETETLVAVRDTKIRNILTKDQITLLDEYNKKVKKSN